MVSRLNEAVYRLVVAVAVLAALVSTTGVVSPSQRDVLQSIAKAQTARRSIFDATFLVSAPHFTPISTWPFLVQKKGQSEMEWVKALKQV